MSKSTSSSLSVRRRTLLQGAAFGAAGLAAAPWLIRPAAAKVSQITFNRESAYVPLFDKHIREVMAPAYEKQTGIRLNYETDAAGGGAVPHLISIAQARGPIDLAWVQAEAVYRDALLEVSDLGEAVGKAQGGWHEEVLRLSVWQGKWKSIPFGNIGQIMVFRRDWFEEAGIKDFPDTWEEFYEAGVKLKRKGHPFGMSMGHGFADNNSWLQPLMWSYGSQAVAADGKTITLDSAETAKSIEYVRKLYKDACIDDCVGWLDIHNNKAFLTSQISCTNNATSILISAKRDLPEMAKVIDHAENPRGPKGRFHALVPVNHGIFAHTPDAAAAKAFLRWFMDAKNVAPLYAAGDMYYAPFLKGYDASPEWQKEPRFLPCQRLLKTGKLPLWPAPTDVKSGQVYATFVIADMFARACTGTSTRQVIADTVEQLKKIYAGA
jgi:multiple sugar transport system substrate-binding protein